MQQGLRLGGAAGGLQAEACGRELRQKGMSGAPRDRAHAECVADGLGHVAGQGLQLMQTVWPLRRYTLLLQQRTRTFPLHAISAVAPCHPASLFTHMPPPPTKPQHHDTHA